MLGQWTLNLAFIVYFFLYLPQVIHNQKHAHLQGLSPWMHLILYFAYLLDLIYGIAGHFPWQYSCVAGMGSILLTVQHFQMLMYFKRQNDFFKVNVFFVVAILIILMLWRNFYIHFEPNTITFIGYLAQSGFILAMLPQIIKSKILRSAQAINIIYILLNIFLAGLDVVTAWNLNWGWPNKLGALSFLAMSVVLFVQNYIYENGIVYENII